MVKADLAQAMRKQANSAAAAAPPPVKPAASGVGSVAYTPLSRAGKRQIAAYFQPAVKKQLKLLTVENDSTVQGLLAEALNDLFAKYGKPEIAPTDTGQGA